MAYASPASLFMRIRTGLLSTIPTCSLMMPMNPLIPARAAIHTLKGHAMPQPPADQIPPPAEMPPATIKVPPDVGEQYLILALQQVALNLATLRGCRLKGITISLEPLPQ